MALVGKKKDDKVDLPVVAPEPVLRVALLNESRLVADEKGVYCHAAFQTEAAIRPRMWELLAAHAQKGGLFELKLVKGDPVGEEGSD